MQKNVLITGCTSGLGRAISLQLAAENYRVFSSVRNQEEAESLKGISKNIRTVIMDVTDPNQVAEVYHEVSASCENGLFALINNAATMYVTPFELASEERMRHLYEVNLFAPLRLMKLFLPLIKNFKGAGLRGKIVNVASWAGIMASPWTSFYGSSKSALIGISEGIFHELQTQSVDVITLVAGLMKTPFLSKTAAEVAENLNKVKDFSIYQNELKYLDKMTRKTNNLFLIPGPEKIAKKVTRILKKKKPQHRYMVGFDSKIVNLLVHFTPFCFRQAMLRNMYQLKKSYS